MLWVSLGFFPNPASASQATDIKAKGVYQFTGVIGNSSFLKDDPADRFQAYQRLRTQIDFIASESLKGVAFLEIGHIAWGNGADPSYGNTGGALGTDGTNVKTRYLYVDWVIPQTEVQVRMGLQNFALPSFTDIGAAVLGGGVADGAGITVSGQFTENVGATLFWLRAQNDNAADKTLRADYDYSDAMDFVGLTVPVTFDGVKVTPWAMYGAIGRDSFDNAGTKASVSNLLPVAGLPNLTRNSNVDRHGDAWWLGIASELTMFDPFRVALDAAYGSVDMGSVGNYDIERAGWYAAALAEYKLDFMTPGIKFWYGSGDDSNVNNGSEMLPTIRADLNLSNYGYDGAYYNAYNSMFGLTPAGTWGVYAYLKDISFIEDLSHVLRVGYVQGTNNTEMANFVGTPIQKSGYNQLYLTTADKAWEVNFDTTYNIYKNLTMVVELGYIHLDLDDATWGKHIDLDNVRENNFRGGISMQYAF